MNEMLDIAVESFPWESDEQREGYLNFVQYQRQFGMEPALPIDPVVTYFIQKDHESNDYWRELVSSQVTDLQSQLRSLQQETSGLVLQTQHLRDAIKDQRLIIDLLAQHVNYLNQVKDAENKALVDKVFPPDELTT